MKFCEKCDNMVSLQTDETHTLVSVCIQCGYSKVITDSKVVSIHKKMYKKDGGFDPMSLINEFTHMDPTLPRLRNKTCVNDNCLSRKGKLYRCRGMDVERLCALSKVSEEHVSLVKKMGADEILFSSTVDHDWEKYDGIQIYENEVVYIKYDDENMKYVYICTCCSRAWTNE